MGLASSTSASTAGGNVAIPERGKTRPTTSQSTARLQGYDAPRITCWSELWARLLQANIVVRSANSRSSEPLPRSFSDAYLAITIYAQHAPERKVGATSGY